MELIDEELIGRQQVQTVGGQRVRRKVLDIVCDDSVRAGMDRGRQGSLCATAVGGRSLAPKPGIR